MSKTYEATIELVNGSQRTFITDIYPHDSKALNHYLTENAGHIVSVIDLGETGFEPTAFSRLDELSDSIDRLGVGKGLSLSGADLEEITMG